MRALLFTLGMHTEHNRFDRDTFIQVNFENVAPNAANALSRYPRKSVCDKLKTQFNFDSLMLYASWAFSKNGKPTLQSLIKGYEVRDQSKKPSPFSLSDIWTLNDLYSCPLK